MGKGSAVQQLNGVRIVNSRRCTVFFAFSRAVGVRAIQFLISEDNDPQPISRGFRAASLGTWGALSLAEEGTSMPSTTGAWNKGLLFGVALAAAGVMHAPRNAHAMIASTDCSDPTAIDCTSGGGSTTTTTNYLPTTEFIGGQTPRPAGLVTVYVHGRNTVNGGDNGSQYWLQGGADLRPSITYGDNPLIVRWRGADALSSSYWKVKNDLDYACGAAGGYQSCQIVCHSTGCELIGWILAEHASEYPGTITHVYALGGAQGGTPGATRMIQVQQGLSASITDLIVGHFGGNALIGAIVKPFVDEAVNWAMSLFPMGSVTGVIYDLVPDRARSLYNHDIGPVTQTFTADHDKQLSKCKWYSIGCHLNNAGKGLYNGVWYWLLEGRNDGVVPVQSTASHRYQSDNRNICASSKFTNHYTTQSCGRGIVATVHMNLDRFLYEAHIYTTPTAAYDACDESETEGSCNSYDDYLSYHVTDTDGSAYNARCGGYELSTNNTAYGSDCNTFRYSGSGGFSTGYDDATCSGCYVSGGTTSTGGGGGGGGTTDTQLMAQ